MRKTRTIEINEPQIICRCCGEDVDSIECSNEDCTADDGSRHCFYDDEVIYCDGSEHYCEKCGKTKSKRKKK